MNRNDPPFHVARRAPPPLSIPTPPRPNWTPSPRINAPTPPNPHRQPCGFCARVRANLRRFAGFGS
jgi:hypothetical protein